MAPTFYLDRRCFDPYVAYGPVSRANRILWVREITLRGVCLVRVHAQAPATASLTDVASRRAPATRASRGGTTLGWRHSNYWFDDRSVAGGLLRWLVNRTPKGR